MRENTACKMNLVVTIDEVQHCRRFRPITGSPSSVFFFLGVIPNQVLVDPAHECVKTVQRCHPEQEINKKVKQRKSWHARM